jgi:hypothetical protein
MVIGVKYYYLDLYRDFSCLAGKCPSTCCSGWKICVDTESVERFRSLSDETLREDILEHMVQRDGQYYFKNSRDGRCGMLDEDGLCRIQRNTEESVLCVTCRKYPRLAGKVRGDVWMSMAASCPVVASFLWSGSLGFFCVEEGISHPVDILDIPMLQDRLDFVRERYGISLKFPVQRAERKKETVLGTVRKSEKNDSKQHPEELLAAVRHSWRRYQAGYDVVSGCLALLTEYREPGYLEGSFDYFEQTDKSAVDVFQDMKQYEQSCGADLAGFYSNYLVYRLYSNCSELCDHQKETGYREIFGEMALFHMIHFSRYHTLSVRDEQEKQRSIQEINWCYRFFAHGEVRKKAFSEMLRENFPREEELLSVFWNDL